MGGNNCFFPVGLSNKVPIGFIKQASPPLLEKLFLDENTKLLGSVRELLINNGYVIDEYAPTEGFLFTDYKYHDWGTGERMLALIVDIDDKITITAKGKMAIPVAGIGGRDRILRIKSVDKLPYRVQKKIFFPLINSMDSLGYNIIEQYP